MNVVEKVGLNRLLEIAQAERLLADFRKIAPESQVALLRLDGRLYAGEAGLLEGVTWETLVEEIERLENGQAITRAGAKVYPLWVGKMLVGALAAAEPASGDHLTFLLDFLKYHLAQAFEKREMARETLDRYREINLLYHIGETIGACLEPDEIPHLVLKEAQRVIPASVRLVLQPPKEGGELEIKAAVDEVGYQENLTRAARTLLSQVSRSGQPDILVDGLLDNSPFGSILCAPIKARERMLGIVLLGRLAGQAVFTASDEKLLMALAGQAGIAIEKAWLHHQEIKRQRMEEELSIGRKIQLSLLPDACPEIPDWEFAVAYQAAQQVGGDYYDYFVLPETGNLGLVIADVTGKGVPAALMMAFSRAIMRAESLSGKRPSAVLNRVNRLILEDSRSRLFLTGLYAILDPKTGRLTYSNGGHEQPMLYRRAENKCQVLSSRGFMLGAFTDIQMEEYSAEIAPGDQLIMFTDGITEARNSEGELFSDERLREVVDAHGSSSAAELLSEIVRAVNEFVGDHPQADDFTLLLVKRSG